LPALVLRKKKIKQRVIQFAYILVMIKKSGFKFFIQKLVFQSLFDLKHLRNRDKPINYLKKQKKTFSKIKINLK
jgi:hypothetical protein